MHKFISVHTGVEIHFNLDRHLKCPETLKQDQSSALGERLGIHLGLL